MFEVHTQAVAVVTDSLVFSCFISQYEAFCLHMSCEEVKEAAMALTDLYEYNVYP